MSEADILSIRNELTGLVVSVVSVSFGMISAYIAGLWLFLREAPISLRLLAFTLLSCGLAFMGALTWGLNDLLVGTDRAWAKLISPASDIPGFGNARPPWLHGLTLYEAAALLGSFAFGAIYISLAYLTFVYRWPGSTAGPVRVSQ
ncbi:hypothetical protein [Hyphomicrobium sp.]|uniref:hypothetical protein n=1 Tax=Hyphomicrobium sp. TaxID=82 RepID=UPI001DB78F40|nr:hypothetical protein [Hyphomicrobium sp.]MBY0559435.1 hypothetical protein [Hyphomicrobium sp.]